MSSDITGYPRILPDVSAKTRRTSRSARRLAAVSLLVLLGLGTSAASAWAASTGWTPVTQTVSGEAQFSGSYKWYSNGDNHGGFEVYGTLYDLDTSNSRGVKFQVHTDGFSPTVWKAATDKDRSIPDTIYYSAGSSIAHYGYYQTCQVNTITPDDCTSWAQKTNPYY